MTEQTLPHPFKDKNLLCCLGLVVFIQLGLTPIIPVLPLMSTKLGFSIGKASLAVAVYTLPSIFLTPFAGYLVDRFGRKEVLIPSVLLYAIAGGLCAFASSYVMLLWLRFFQGVGVVTFDVLFATIIGDLYHGKERVRNMGYVTTTFSLSTAIMPIIGGGLALIHWRIPFVLPIIALGYVFVVIKHLQLPKNKTKIAIAPYLRSVKQALFLNRAIVVYGMTVFGSIGTFGAFQIYFPKLIATDFAGSPVAIGGMLTFTALISAAVSTQLVLINKLLSKRMMLLTSFILYPISICLVPFITNYYCFALPMLLNGIAQGMAYSMMLTVLSEASGKGQRGAVMAINASMLTLGQSIAPFILLIPYNLGGYGWTFTIAAIFMAGCAYLVRFIKPTPSLIR